MPILGVIASSTRQGQSTDAGAMYPLQVITVGSAGASSITFSNIPSTYTHLQLRYISRGTTSALTVETRIRFNNDSGASAYYGGHQLFGDGASATANADGTTSSSYLMFSPAASEAANIFAVGVTDILDYSNSNKNKTIRSLGGFDKNGATGYVLLRSGLWINTNAITSISIYPVSDNFAQNSQFALYAVKGA